jgi:hypothetical protein
MTNAEINDFIYFLKDEPPQEIIFLSAVHNTYKNSKVSVPEIINELMPLDIIDINGQKYSLKYSAKQKLQSLPRDYEGKPYEYFLFEQQKKKEDEESGKWYNRENARLQYEDYPKTQRMAKAAFYISAALLILEVVKLLIRKN